MPSPSPRLTWSLALDLLKVQLPGICCTFRAKLDTFMIMFCACCLVLHSSPPPGVFQDLI